MLLTSTSAKIKRLDWMRRAGTWRLRADLMFQALQRYPDTMLDG